MSREKIKIGDEVIHNTEKYIVVAISSNGSYFCLRKDGKFLGEYFENVLEKTGKHFDQIVDVLNQINSNYEYSKAFIKENFEPVEDKPGYVWFSKRNFQIISIETLQKALQNKQGVIRLHNSPLRESEK